MQRAATGLAHAVARLLGASYGARVLLLVGSGDNGGDALWAGAHLARRGCGVHALLCRGACTPRASPRCGPPGTGVDTAWPRWPVRTTTWCSTAWSATAVDRPAPRGGGRPGGRARCARGGRRTPSGVDVDTGELDGARPRARRPHRHLRHAQGARTSSTRPRPPADRCTWSTSASTCPPPTSRPPAGRRRRAAAAPGARRPEVHTRRRRRAGRLGDLSRRGPAVGRGRGHRLVGMVRQRGRQRRHRPGCARPTPRSSDPAGCRPGWSAPGGGEAAGEELRAALADGVPVVRQVREGSRPCLITLCRGRRRRPRARARHVTRSPRRRGGASRGTSRRRGSPWRARCEVRQGDEVELGRRRYGMS